ncbi:unnamed protein product [Candida verbasci]|uniref:Structural maintenance of chromosomes protein 5 n=1 Tax=Candida verbasci TaxID=1227364 RepID=A0A9W4X837_9ASCO|nr:unnamed protein product [Candida verbasci]
MENGSAAKRQKTHQPLSFKPGGLKYVKVWNFTTYSFAEFNLSPTLNMIIGPNGSGKSTLVASICIGLAGNINLIKRKNLKSMIKTGHGRATIEITIENFDNKPPIIIKREFSAKDSVWTINNRKSTEKEVKELCKKFNIQLDNLCHFLPQERVAEFAGLQPDKLLLETERTLGDGHLLKMHEDLIDKDAASQELGKKIDDTQQKLDALNQERAKLEEDARKVEEYEAKAKQINDHKLLIPYAKYSDLKKTQSHLKQQRDQAKNRLKSFAKNYEQLNEDKEEIENQHSIERKELYKKEKELQDVVREVEKYKNDQKELKNNIMELTSNAAQYRNKAEQKKCELIQNQEELARLIEKKDSIRIVDKEEIENLHQEMTKKRSSMREDEDEINVIRNTLEELNGEIKKLKEKIDRENRGLQSNDKLDILMRRSDKPMRLRDESYTAHKKLREKPEIADKYFEAPVISCEVKDSSIAPALEKVIENGALFAITVTSNENQRLINRAQDHYNWNISTRAVSSIVKPRNDLSKEELRKYKLEGYLSDHITGPPEVLSMIYNNSKIDRIPYTNRILTPEELEKIIKETSFTKLVTGDVVHTIRKSYYGNKQVVRQTEIIPPSQFFSVQGLSPDDKDRINETINEYLKEIEEKEKEFQKLKIKNTNLQSKRAVLKNEFDELKSQHQELKKLTDDITHLESKIELKKSKIEKLEQDSNKDYTQRIKAYEKRIIEKYNSISEISKKLSSIVSKSSKLETEIVFKNFEILNLKNRQLTCESLIKELDEIKVNLERDFIKYKKEYDQLKESAVYKETVKMNSEKSPEEIEFLSQLAQEYIDNDTFSEKTIVTKIQLLEDELSILSSADKSSIENLKTKLQEIERAEKDLPIFKIDKERLDRRILTIKEAWETELTELVDQISIAFNQRFTKVASDGRVELGKSERFKDWKLQILVKFREQSELKILDHQSQSGGERAVSTIFFIMSLQGLTDAPFRIVDEINQGMDPKNEQMAHKYLVHTACQNNKSQYFLVTPKLLTGLYYHPDMVIHCIFTGPLIEPNQEGRKFLDFVGKAEAVQ